MVNKEILGIRFEDSFPYWTYIPSQFQPDWPFWPILYADTLIIDLNRHYLHWLIVRKAETSPIQRGVYI